MQPLTCCTLISLACHAEASLTHSRHSTRSLRFSPTHRPPTENHSLAPCCTCDRTVPQPGPQLGQSTVLRCWCSTFDPFGSTSPSPFGGVACSAVCSGRDFEFHLASSPDPRSTIHGHLRSWSSPWRAVQRCSAFCCAVSVSGNKKKKRRRHSRHQHPSQQPSNTATQPSPTSVSTNRFPHTCFRSLRDKASSLFLVLFLSCSCSCFLAGPPSFSANASTSISTSPPSHLLLDPPWPSSSHRRHPFLDLLPHIGPLPFLHPSSFSPFTEYPFAPLPCSTLLLPCTPHPICTLPPSPSRALSSPSHCIPTQFARLSKHSFFDILFPTIDQIENHPNHIYQPWPSRTSRLSRPYPGPPHRLKTLRHPNQHQGSLPEMHIP